MPRQKKARSSEPPKRRRAARRPARASSRRRPDLVYRRGASGTSLEDIMAASATSKSQLYHYFADKDALMRAVIELQTRRVTGDHAARLKAVDSLTGLRRWGDSVVAMNKAAGGVGGCPLGSLASELADRSESARRNVGARLCAMGIPSREGLAGNARSRRTQSQRRSRRISRRR